MSDVNEKKEELETELSDNENIKNNGEVTLEDNFHHHRIYQIGRAHV